MKEIRGCHEVIGGELRISRRGVPHIVVSDHSVCWMGRNRVYRVFYPYGADPQSRKDFVDVAGVQEFLTNRYAHSSRNQDLDGSSRNPEEPQVKS